jgi:hypothetical protein
MSTESTSRAFPWNWWTAFLPTPQNLTQPILPGWTLGPVLTINNDNSSAPQTEAEVVQRHSYGRQLGRIADALEALIKERGPGVASDERFKDFLEMKKEIDTVKLDAAVSRAEQLRRDLASLKATRSTEYRRLRDAVRRVLDE